MCKSTVTVKKRSLDKLSKVVAYKSKDSTVKKIRSFKVDKTKMKERSNENLAFSFEIFDRTHQAFNLGKIEYNWFISLLDVLNDMSTMPWKDILIERRSIYDPHTHNWNKTNYKFNFDEETLNQNEGWQFRLNKSKGRVHGFLVGNVFYIYWLDPHHNMNDSEGYPGVETYPPSLSQYEIVEQCNLQQEQTISELQKQLKDAEDLYYKEAEKCDNCTHKK
ncbi:hypothetical protein GT646_05015 [Clostridium butyricum]|uniref:hypothetical protein n=1 Tax=Clostridium butyricum TaxID=1492 RepID=UPI00136DAD12|nr:hypothetical protein [Clostridium butyricum]MZI80205.1 hypothetical protein [Clostridium butyricum]